jgi:hypothetical protein
VSGNLSEHQPLGVVVHSSTIGGNVQEVGGSDDRSAGDDQSGGGSDGRDGNEVGGGGGFTCTNKGPTVAGFPVFGAAFGGLPVYSGYEDSTVHGNLSVIGLTSCWLGVARVQVSGNVDLINNQLADPDAIEILSNQISGNLRCQQNSQVWDSAEHVPRAAALVPRDSMPNTVSGHRVGQCMLASPATDGGPSGPGAF